MDRSVKPGDDFFRYANGNWLERTEIPADRSSYGAGAVLAELTDRRVADLIQATAKADAPAGSDSRKIGGYYTSFMDSTAIDAAGLRPLQPTLDSIAAIGDRADLAGFLGSTLRADVDVVNTARFYTGNLLGLWVAQDLDDPTHYSRSCSRAGSGCRTGATTSTRRRRWPRSGPSTRRTSRRC
jgi:putative endopeptidase